MLRTMHVCSVLAFHTDGSLHVLLYMQLFEFLLTIVGSAKLMKVLFKVFDFVCAVFFLHYVYETWFMQVVKNNIKELAYYTIAFLQMTEQQVIFYNIFPLYVLVLLCYLMVIVDKCICLDICRCLGRAWFVYSLSRERLLIKTLIYIYIYIYKEVRHLCGLGPPQLACHYLRFAPSRPALYFTHRPFKWYHKKGE